MENVFGFKELGILAKKYGDEEPGRNKEIKKWQK